MNVKFSSTLDIYYIPLMKENGRPPSSVVVPFAVDTFGNFCSVAIIFLKKLAKPSLRRYLVRGSKEFQDLTASTWVNT